MDVISAAHEALGHEVRRRREALHLNQADLAERSGLHRNYVGGIERGERNVTLTNLLRLAAALETTASGLVASVDGRPGPAQARVSR